MGRQRAITEESPCHSVKGGCLSWPPAAQVAIAFTKRDPIRTHARDELGIDIDELANPLQVRSTLTLCSCCRPSPV